MSGQPTPGTPDIVDAILAVQQGLHRKTTLLIWTHVLLGAAMVLSLVVSGLALAQSRDNHQIADNINKTLTLVRSATDPAGQVARRAQQATGTAVDHLIRCVDNHIDVVTLHLPKDPSCP